MPRTTIETEPSSGETDVSPIPPLFYLSLFIPTFFVVVWGMQKLLAPRVPLERVHPGRQEEDDAG